MKTHKWPLSRTSRTKRSTPYVSVGGLYLTSPPDTLDALLLVSPTPSSVYGVTAMWRVVVTALLSCSAGGWNSDIYGGLIHNLPQVMDALW